LLRGDFKRALGQLDIATRALEPPLTWSACECPIRQENLEVAIQRLGRVW